MLQSPVLNCGQFGAVAKSIQLALLASGASGKSRGEIHSVHPFPHGDIFWSAGHVLGVEEARRCVCIPGLGTLVEKHPRAFGRVRITVKGGVADRARGGGREEQQRQ